MVIEKMSPTSSSSEEETLPDIVPTSPQPRTADIVDKDNSGDSQDSGR